MGKKLNLTNDLFNCVPCCAICNRAKGRSTYEEFINWIKEIKEFNYL